MFRNWKDLNWLNVSDINDNNLYNIIKNVHKIDILVDLISHGVNGRMNLIAMKPAPIIINYLGYPDYCYLKSVNYRLVDKITDTLEFKYTEKLLKMNRCFVCFTPFEVIKTPSINLKIKDPKKIYLGVFNKLSKINDKLCKCWASILEKRKDMIICIKKGSKSDTYDKEFQNIINLFPKDQVYIFPFTETLEEYFDLFNYVDVCIDTTPYSGTTTTCSSLYMGVPVFCIYNENLKHVSNVSGSILYHTDRNEYDKYVCKNIKLYENAVAKWRPTEDKDRSESYRLERRNKFLNYMNPIEFMKDYESLLLSII
jgi:protein O-GlcNAc transferase